MNRGRKHTHGGALVITVLICLAMTGLALAAVTTVNVDTQIAHNQKLMRQAHYVAETGLMIAIQRVQNLGAVSLLRERERLAASANANKKVSFSLASFGENGVFVTSHEDPQVRTLGHEASGIDFYVEVDSLRTANPPAGYQINQDQQPTSLEVGLLASCRVGRFADEKLNTNLTVNTTERRVWALVPVP